jgi:hypothetical protein
MYNRWCHEAKTEILSILFLEGEPDAQGIQALRGGAMELDERIGQYQVLDTMFGVLTTVVELKYYLNKLRLEQLQVRKLALQSRSLIALITMVGGGPALYALIPENNPARSAWPWLLSLLGLVYLVIVLVQWRDQRSEEKSLGFLLSADGGTPLESQEAYILTKVSSYGTRLGAARKILKEAPTDRQRTRRQFQAVQSHFAALLEAEGVRAEELRRNKHLTDMQYGRICEWIESAKAAAQELQETGHGEETG